MERLALLMPLAQRLVDLRIAAAKERERSERATPPKRVKRVPPARPAASMIKNDDDAVVVPPAPRDRLVGMFEDAERSRKARTDKFGDQDSTPPRLPRPRLCASAPVPTLSTGSRHRTLSDPAGARAARGARGRRPQGCPRVHNGDCSDDAKPAPGRHRSPSCRRRASGAEGRAPGRRPRPRGSRGRCTHPAGPRSRPPGTRPGPGGPERPRCRSVRVRPPRP